MSNLSPLRFIRRKADLESLWLVTFADLMVQLMAYFALLYSFSVSDQSKMQQALNSIQKALGVQAQVSGGDGILPGFDFVHRAQRVQNPFPQKPRPHRRGRPVQSAKKRHAAPRA